VADETVAGRGAEEGRVADQTVGGRGAGASNGGEGYSASRRATGRDR
jgi:hypothetical protein